MSCTLQALRRQRLVVFALAAIAMLAASTQLVGQPADAAGPAYSGPQTQATGPAYFGPAPNPFPYCENPTYFDPFPENVTPIGSIDVTGSPNASVTTNEVTMDFELTNNGTAFDPDGQYPGFFPFGGLGAPNDQPKGVEMASDDAAIITLSEPLFYTQWVFTDVDRANEGFFVTPAWTDPGDNRAIAVFGGDTEFDFTGTTEDLAAFNDTNAVGEVSESINGRVQVDLIGAVTGITLVRDTGAGQSGFAIGGGCSPIGVAKEVTSGPTWNGTSFDVTYTLRVRNNLPSASTINADITSALAAAASGTTAGTVDGIEMTAVQLTDVLSDPAFGSIDIISLTNTSGQIAVNADYDGDGETNLIATGEIIPAETEEEFVLSVQYTPDAAGPLGSSCASTFNLENSAEVSGVANGVPVVDESDAGPDPDPGVDNGAGGTDDPTTVVFPCPPAGLEIVKTVVEGPNGTCPAFADGVPGDGDPLAVTSGDTVTYCISVQNPGFSDMTGVEVTDPLAPAGFDGSVGTLAGQSSQTVSFDLVVDEQTPSQNTATATGTSPAGTLEVDDTALIDVSPPVPGGIELSKTVVSSSGSCAAAVEGTDELVVDAPGAAVTWCFTITNTGNASLASISFDDPLLGITDRDVLTVNGGGAPSLAPGASISFEEAGSVAAAGAVNTASVEAVPSEADGTPTGAAAVSDSDDAAVESTSVALSKTVAAGAGADCAGATDTVTVPVGTTVTYCFTVTNTGSVDLEVTEVVDGDLGVTIAVPAGSQVLAPGGSVTVTAEATATALVNTASVTGTPVDPTGSPIPDAPTPTDDDTAEVVTETPGLTIVKTVVAGPDGTCPATVADGTVGDGDALRTSNGSTVTYCLNVANTGDVAIDGVVVSDPMAPTGFDGAIGTLASGAEAVVSFDLEVDADTPVRNTASVTGDDPAGGQLPPSDDTALIERTQADLAVTKTVSTAGPVPVGTLLTYTIVVTNNGPDAAENPTLTDVVPTGIEPEGVPTADGWSCTVNATGFDCARAEAMPNGVSETLTYTARSTTEAAVGSSLTNTVEVASSTDDPDLTNNEDTSTTTTGLVPGDLPSTPEYPGPFTPPSVPATPPAAPSPPLAITGASSTLLTTLATLFLALGGVVAVLGRRERDGREW